MTSKITIFLRLDANVVLTIQDLTPFAFYGSVSTNANYPTLLHHFRYTSAALPSRRSPDDGSLVPPKKTTRFTPRLPLRSPIVFGSPETGSTALSWGARHSGSNFLYPLFNGK